MSNSTPWWTIRNVAPDTTEVYIYEQIGLDWFTGDGISAKAFVDELRAIGTPRIDLHLSSPGGFVFDGITIYQAITRHPATVTVYIDGLAASIASVIACAGDRVVMAGNALMMIHDPSTSCAGTAVDMRRTADALEAVREAILTSYARTNLTRDQLSEAMAAETWYTAEQALEAGFADEIAAEHDMAAHLDLAGLPFLHAANLVPAPVVEPPQVLEEPAVTAAAPRDGIAVLFASGSDGASDRGTSGGAPGHAYLATLARMHHHQER